MFIKSVLLVLSLFYFTKSYPLFDDPCLLSPCELGYICVSSKDSFYECVKERIVKTSASKPVEQIHIPFSLLDPCLSSPCMFGKVCKSLNQHPWFICLNELELSPESTEARNLYKKKVLKYNDALYSNIEQIVKPKNKPKLNVLTLKTNQKFFDPCSDNPCHEGLICQPDEEDIENFICIKQDQNQTPRSSHSIQSISDVCLNNPCQDGYVCQPDPENNENFECVQETNLISINQNENRIRLEPKQKETILTLKSKTNSFNVDLDPCSSNPCQEGYICEPDKEEMENFICIKQDQNQTPRSSHSIQSISDVCLNNPCQDGYVCQPDPENNENFECVQETNLISINQNENRIRLEPKQKETILTLKSKTNSFNVDLDPCSSNPCHEGLICQPDEEDPHDFVCLEPQKQQQIIQPQPEKMDACFNNPCHDGFTCVINKDNKDTFSCVDSLILNKKQEEKNRRLLTHDTFVSNITEQCRKLDSVERIAHPINPNQFIVCLDNSNFLVMDCPDKLVFNQYLDRCDFTSDPISSGCESTPCQYGAECVDLPNFEYKCNCPEGFSGVNCEIAPDFCAQNPCGTNGVCHSLPSTSPIPYYCTCSNQKLFGINCDTPADIEPNPCLSDDSDREVHPTKLDPSVYVHCDNNKMYLKFCQRPLVFSPEHQECEWIDLKMRRILK